MTTGLDEILQNITKLQLNNKRVAREAVSDAADLVEINLIGNTPSDEGEMRSNTVVSGFKGGPQGRIEKDIGYSRAVGWRVKYPDTGTINQRPQNFKEKTIEQSKPEVLSIYAGKITEGLKL